MPAPSDPFALAAAHTLGIEGGYADDPADRGGKTQWGITEAVARADGYTGDMRALPKARALAIYRRLYWDRIGLDWIAAVDSAVACEVFDTGVNQGVAIAGRFLQRVLNVLNRAGRDYPDLVVDGVAGPATADALRALIRVRRLDVVIAHHGDAFGRIDRCAGGRINLGDAVRFDDLNRIVERRGERC